MEIDEREVRRFLVERDGPKAAAWLVWQHRRALHRTGAIEMRLIAGFPLPAWFSYAIQTLRSRTRSWEVVEFLRGNERVWMVMWKGWLRHARRRA